jgi:flavin reductase (DIM6/NTAB) family NADH-FMN oxidoreductase RutF
MAFCAPAPAKALEMSRTHSEPHPLAIEALSRLPRGRLLLTASAGDLRRGRLVDWVQQCGAVPPAVMLALPKGDPISPLIRDSRHFCLSILRGVDPLLERLFATRQEGDPFLGLPVRTSPLGVPIVDRGDLVIECEMIRHLDIDGDCELYVGVVRHAEPLSPPPRVRAASASPARLEEPRLRAKDSKSQAPSRSTRLRREK